MNFAALFYAEFHHSKDKRAGIPKKKSLSYFYTYPGFFHLKKRYEILILRGSTFSKHHFKVFKVSLRAMSFF